MVSPKVKADSDEFLMQRVQQQDESAFTTLVHRHTRSIHAFVYRLCGDRSDAEDLTQETFLRVWQRANHWQPNAVKVTTWLHQIARNLCIDSFRRTQSIKRTVTTEGAESTVAPIDELESAEQASAIRTAIFALPERQRTALVLCQIQGWSQQDAAQVLDTTINGIQALIGRARRTLRKDLVKMQ